MNIANVIDNLKWVFLNSSKISSGTLSYYNALRFGLIGKEYFKIGRRIGWKALCAGERIGRSQILTPVNCTRYFEFCFTQANIKTTDRCADISSPRLFSIDFAQRNHCSDVFMINPDPTDIAVTQKFVNLLDLHNLGLLVEDIGYLKNYKSVFDSIWSISVLEHINTDGLTDCDALQLMFDALKAGGRLIITVPVDKPGWVEFRNKPEYNGKARTQNEGDGRYFFQRFYDDQIIKERMTEVIGKRPSIQAWYGEKEKGHFHKYIKNWLINGSEVTINDPLEMARNYQLFDSYDLMPGAGVCGLVFEK